MKIKETICTEIDGRGRVVRRTRTIDIDESYTDRGYDYGTRYGEPATPRRSSLGRIMEAYEDYRRTEQW